MMQMFTERPLRSQAENEAQRDDADAKQWYDVIVVEGKEYSQLFTRVQVGIARVLHRVFLPFLKFYL
jgi:hypothetical protein